MIAAAELSRALGGEVVRVRGEEQVLAPGIGHSPGDRSLSVRFGPRGLQVHSFAGDDLKDERARLRKLCGRGTRTTEWTAPRSARPLAPSKPSPAALWLWSESTHPWNTRAERYLNKRGLFVPPYAAEAAIRFNHHCKFKGEVVTAMIALVRHIATDQAQGVHITALSWADTSYEIGGTKRICLGPAQGGAIKLTPHTAVHDELGVGEGIESSLSLLYLDRPPGAVWSLISATGVAQFPVLPQVKRLHIAVDHDKAGEDAAGSCANRWRCAGREVILHEANRPGLDLNDIARGRLANA